MSGPENKGILPEYNSMQISVCGYAVPKTGGGRCRSRSDETVKKT